MIMGLAPLTIIMITIIIMTKACKNEEFLSGHLLFVIKSKPIRHVFPVSNLLLLFLLF